MTNDGLIPIERPRSAAADEILGLYFPVLDNGFCALVDYMGNDEAIEQAARVSYGGGTRKTSETRGLLRYLRRQKHTSPSEMCELKFHCAMPIFVARQWIRHRTANVSEASGRYSLLPMVFYTPPEAQFRKQSTTNKQGRGDEAPAASYGNSVDRWNVGRQLATDTYNRLTSEDVARELARIDLPLSTYTQWYWKIDLHNLLHFLTLRVDSHAQWEIQEFGRVMAGMLKRVAPISYEAWIDYDVCGVRLSRMERDVLARLVRTDERPAAEGPPYRGIGHVRGLGPVKDFVDSSEMAEYGLVGRELDEFLAKFEAPEALAAVPRPSFDLDPSAARPGSWFSDRFAAAVPAAERR